MISSMSLWVHLSLVPSIHATGADLAVEKPLVLLSKGVSLLGSCDLRGSVPTTCLRHVCLLSSGIIP